MAYAIPTDRPMSVRNICVIEDFVKSLLLTCNGNGIFVTSLFSPVIALQVLVYDLARSDLL